MSRLFRYLFTLFCGAVPALVLFFCILPLRRKNFRRKGLASAKLRETGMALLWMYCGGMVLLALTPYWVSASLVDLANGYRWNAGGAPFFKLGGVNFTPLQTFQTDGWSLFNLAGNIVMFIPFGFFAALLWRGYTWKRALLTGFCITGFVECWQLCVGRAFDIDDIILNTLGVFCGYLLWRLMKKLVPKFTRRFPVMDILELVEPTMEYKDQVMDFKAEMLEYGSDFDGCNGLREAETYEEWLDFRGRAEARGRAPSQTWLTVRRSDGRVVGMINYRPSPLSDFLLQYGGHIGYCIRPTERRKGYAKEQLSLTLEKCRTAGEERVLLTCDPDTASEKTILANGGVLENEVEDTPGLGNSGRIRRYWIAIK